MSFDGPDAVGNRERGDRVMGSGEASIDGDFAIKVDKNDDMKEDAARIDPE